MRGVLASWKRTRKVIVRRIDQATGEMRWRKVARRYHCRAPPTPRRRPGGRYLAVMPRFVRALIAARRVRPFLEIGKLTRFDVDDLDGRLDRCQVEVARTTGPDPDATDAPLFYSVRQANDQPNGDGPRPERNPDAGERLARSTQTLA